MTLGKDLAGAGMRTAGLASLAYVSGVPSAWQGGNHATRGVWTIVVAIHVASQHIFRAMNNYVNGENTVRNKFAQAFGSLAISVAWLKAMQEFQILNFRGHAALASIVGVCFGLELTFAIYSAL